jgi:hypothetical protein
VLLVLLVLLLMMMMMLLLLVLLLMMMMMTGRVEWSASDASAVCVSMHVVVAPMLLARHCLRRCRPRTEAS